LELARGEKHAEAVMHIARTCDERTSELKEQHAAVTAKVEDENATLKAKLVELAASHAAAISKWEAQHKETTIKLEAENAALKAQAASTLAEILAAVTTGAMEILPVRSDSRQFVEWRFGGIPPLTVPQFDRGWCAAVCVDGWKAEVVAAAGDARVKVTQGFRGGCCTLRSAAQLSRGAGGPQLPMYRVVIEEHSKCGSCVLGFVPNHETHGNGAVAPMPNYNIRNYGGWYIIVIATYALSVQGETDSGWTVLPPGSSAYATTAVVPPVPAGSAVEFAVDYAAGTCRVAFYTPVAVAGGFVEAPHAKMELRFVATAEHNDSRGLIIPARTVPTAADSGVGLYPAVSVSGSGNVCRFGAV
jgi:hypothetical protein